MTVVPFNPLDKKNLGASVAEALLTKDVHPLGDLPKFVGAGIYALYYTGDLPVYENLAKMNRNGLFMWPIYVGKAVPSGSRRGIETDKEMEPALLKRLREHAASIRSTQLRIEDFFCRFLVVDDIWIPLGESLIITRFTPVWNTLIDGFGNHTPGSGREKGMLPKWDTLHPGRKWAEKLPLHKDTPEEIGREAEVYLRNVPPVLSKQFIEADGD